jgi:hypothetical protein
MGIISIQQKIAWFSVGRSRTLYRMGSWLGSLHRNKFGKRISKDTHQWKEIEKVSDMRNRGVETRLQERVGMVIEKRSKGMLERCRDLSRIRKWSERSTPF